MNFVDKWHWSLYSRSEFGKSQGNLWIKFHKILSHKILSLDIPSSLLMRWLQRLQEEKSTSIECGTERYNYFSPLCVLLNIFFCCRSISRFWRWCLIDDTRDGKASVAINVWNVFYLLASLASYSPLWQASESSHKLDKSFRLIITPSLAIHGGEWWWWWLLSEWFS